MENSQLVDEEGDYQPIRCFLGYDRRSPIGHHICEQSIIENSTQAIAITPLYLSTLKHIFTREREPNQLTDFTFSRFLVPFLSGYHGWSLFLDGNDMLILGDMAELWKLRDAQYAIMVVKHPEFKGEHSFMGNSHFTYSRWNWSSVILFNNAKCRALTPLYVNTADYYDLHQFKWIQDSSLIGELPNNWNHLVGYYPPRADVQLIHWTLGLPNQESEFENSEHAEKWFQYKKKLT